MNEEPEKDDYRCIDCEEVNDISDLLSDSDGAFICPNCGSELIVKNN